MDTLDETSGPVFVLDHFTADSLGFIKEKIQKLI